MNANSLLTDQEFEYETRLKSAAEAAGIVSAVSTYTALTKYDELCDTVRKYRAQAQNDPSGAKHFLRLAAINQKVVDLIDEQYPGEAMRQIAAKTKALELAHPEGSSESPDTARSVRRVFRDGSCMASQQ